MVDSPDQPIVIELENVGKTFGSFHALKGVDLEVQLGERVIICGPSGSGKSTLIRCINQLESNNHGKLHLNQLLNQV